MKKHLLIALMLVLTAVMLCGCGQEDTYPTVSNTAPSVITQVPALAVTNAPAATDYNLPEGYDPSSEEDEGTYAEGAYDQYGKAIYAGATPIPIDPIDLPTATPRPELTFTYGAYSADKLGLKFESVVGYTVDDTQEGMYILTEPSAEQKDNYSVVITLQINSITTNYDAADMKTELIEYLDTLGSANYSEWSPTATQTRQLMGKEGIYANYRGVLYDGTIVRGRVHMAIISDTKLLILHLSCPGWYNTSYMNVFTKIRETLEVIK